MEHTHTAPAASGSSGHGRTLIALDLDGTLTNSRKEVTPRTRRALLRAMDGGAVVALASGRPTYGIAPVAEALQLDSRGGYVLAYNGGKVVDWATRRELYAKHLPADLLPLLRDYAAAHGYALLGYTDTHIITERPADPYVQEESRINRMPVSPVADLLQSLPPQPVKLLMTGDPALMAQAEAELSERLSGRMEAFRSAPFFVELVPPGIDKAQSLRRLLAQLRMEPRQLIAFGDGYNDLTMLRLAGQGVAMANAAPEVRAAADSVTASNDEDGVALFLEAWMARAD